METFNGDDKQNIFMWVEEFEETASTCAWSEVQRYIAYRNYSFQIHMKSLQERKRKKSVKITYSTIVRYTR